MREIGRKEVLRSGQKTGTIGVSQGVKKSITAGEAMNEEKMKQIEQAVLMILDAIGEDPSREGLKGTPQRVARMYAELLEGMRTDPSEHIKSIFHEKYDEIVLLRNIPFKSVCEHHMMPFTGRAHVAYLPDGQVLGVSKLARIVDAFAHRLQLQERLTAQICDFLMENLKPQGVAVVLEASHSCMTLRGIQKPGSEMVTSALRGIFKRDPRSRSEVLTLMHKNGS
jgi:GTP cyclohydrolase IA